MTTSSYKPIWPETTVIWGAGATAELGFPATADQGRAILALASAEETRDGVQQAGQFQGQEDVFADLLLALGHASTSHVGEFSADELAAAGRLIPGLEERRCQRHVVALRQTYDWNCLRRVVKICPKTDNGGDFLRDLFNILDYHIQAGRVFPLGPLTGKEDPSVKVGRLLGARNCLTMLISSMFWCACQNMLSGLDSKLHLYSCFADELASLMSEEGRRLSAEFEFSDRCFYLFSYAMISLNWDPLLLWLLFNAHRSHNNSSPPCIGSPATPMKLFHDMSHFMAVRQIDGKTPQAWYPLNETVAQRLNDREHATGRRVRIGKFYFPHGCLGWRECSNCGKLTAWLGDNWGLESKSILPPPIVAVQQFQGYRRRSTEESAAWDQQDVDAVQCTHCGYLTRQSDTPIVMQSNFKGANPPFVEEIQRDMQVCLQNTRHLVLLGYSLPPDDVVYRSMIAARKSREDSVCCSVVVGYRGPNEWLSGESLSRYLQAHAYSSDAAEWGVPTIKAALEIFESDSVRAYTHGIPQVFGEDGRKGVRDLLYPVRWDIDAFTDRGVTRSGR